MHRAFLLWAVLVWSGLASAQSLPSHFLANCTDIVDGDTIEVQYGGQVLRVRLEGIDAPELGQPFGEEARQRLANLVSTKRVMVSGAHTAGYGHLVARVAVDTFETSQTLVREGLAWQYKEYSNDPELAALEQAARADQKGLWSARSPMPPWEWRAKCHEPGACDSPIRVSLP